MLYISFRAAQRQLTVDGALHKKCNVPQTNEEEEDSAIVSARLCFTATPLHVPHRGAAAVS